MSAEDRIGEFTRRRLGACPPPLAPDEVKLLGDGDREAICVEWHEPPAAHHFQSVARALADGGRFAVRFASGALSRRWSWHRLSAALARSGLWPEAHLLLRDLPLWPGAMRLIPGSLAPLASRVVVAGTRVARQVVEMRDRALGQLADKGCAEIVVASSSMAPTFDIGDRLTVVPCRRPRRGDIVMLQAKTCFVAHRLVAAVGNHRLGWVVHQGDSPQTKPGLAAHWRVVGRVQTVR